MFTVAHKPQVRSAEPHAHVYIRAPYGAFSTCDGYIVVAFPRCKKFGAADRRAILSGHGRRGRRWSRRDEIFAKTRERLARAGRRRNGWRCSRARHLGRTRLLATPTSSTMPRCTHNGTFVEYDHPTEGRREDARLSDQVLPRRPASVYRGAPLDGRAHPGRAPRGRLRRTRRDRRARRGGRRRRVPGCAVMRVSAASPGTTRAASTRFAAAAARARRARDGIAIEWDEAAARRIRVARRSRISLRATTSWCSTTRMSARPSPKACLVPLEDTFSSDDLASWSARRRSVRAWRAIDMPDGTGRCRSTPRRRCWRSGRDLSRRPTRDLGRHRGDGRRACQLHCSDGGSPRRS